MANAEVSSVEEDDATESSLQPGPDEMVDSDVVHLNDLEAEPTRVLSLVKHVDVRWSSMYAMLVRF